MTAALIGPGLTLRVDGYGLAKDHLLLVDDANTTEDPVGHTTLVALTVGAWTATETNLDRRVGLAVESKIAFFPVECNQASWQWTYLKRPLESIALNNQRCDSAIVASDEVLKECKVAKGATPRPKRVSVVCLTGPAPASTTDDLKDVVHLFESLTRTGV